MNWRKTTMNRQDVIKELKDIVLTFLNLNEDEFVVNDIDEDDVLNDGEFGLDSLSLINVIVEIERRFSITIEDEYLSMDFLSSIGAMADFILECIDDTSEEFNLE